MRALATALAMAGVLAAAGCGGARTAAKPTTTAGPTLASPRAAQIALARASNPGFSIFPAKPGGKACAIPEGGVHRKPGTLAGTCFTTIHREDSHEPALVVTFVEYWTFGPPCPPGDACALVRSFHHAWRVIEGEPNVTSTSRFRVLATREDGATAPQYYK